MDVLQRQLELLEELLAAKDQELAAKEETLVLLREKVSRLEKLASHPASKSVAAQNPANAFEFMGDLQDPWAGPGGRGAPPVRKAQKKEEPPKGMWARFYHWFREA
jgi:hypothetical protein